MAVTVYLVEWNGTDSPGTVAHDNYQFDNHVVTAATNLNFGSVDQTDLTPATNQIAPGDNSFSKHFKLQFSGAFTSISNVKVYKHSGEYVSGESIKFSGSVGFAQPSITTTGDPDLCTTFNDVCYIGLGGYGDLATHSRTLPAAGESESSPGYYSGSRTDLFRLQLQTTGAAPIGSVNEKTIIFYYDRT